MDPHIPRKNATRSRARSCARPAVAQCATIRAKGFPHRHLKLESTTRANAAKKEAPPILGGLGNALYPKPHPCLMARAISRFD